MTRWVGLLVGMLVLFGASEASAGAMTYGQVKSAFNGVTGCSRDIASTVGDIEKTRNVKARGKAAGARVNPAAIAGMVYLNKLIGPKGKPGGIVANCQRQYAALIGSDVMRYIPDSWKRPGSTVARGTNSLKAIRIPTAALQNVKRMRLSGVNSNIAQLRKQSSEILTAVNALSREAQKMNDYKAPGKKTTSAARHFDALRNCGSKMATLATAMKTYRDRTYRGKPVTFKVAPRRAIGARNIDDIVKRGGWLDKCVAEHAKMTRDPMKRYLPRDFLKPHHGTHARMKAALAAIRINGAYLKGNRPQQLRQIDKMFANFRKGTSDFLSGANYAHREASKVFE